MAGQLRATGATNCTCFRNWASPGPVALGTMPRRDGARLRAQATGCTGSRRGPARRPGPGGLPADRPARPGRPGPQAHPHRQEPEFWQFGRRHTRARGNPKSRERDVGGRRGSGSGVNVGWEGCESWSGDPEEVGAFRNVLLLAWSARPRPSGDARRCWTLGDEGPPTSYGSCREDSWSGIRLLRSASRPL